MTYYSRYFFGSFFDDVIEANDRSNIIFGFFGSDMILAGGGNDLVFAGSGNDIVFGGAGHDRLYGGRGDDALFGEAGNDLLIGGRGNDNLDGGAGFDVLYAGRGQDTLTYVAAENTSNYDFYDGGRGIDSLIIQVNSTLANDQTFLSEIEALRDHIAEYTTSSGQFWGPSFLINSLNLRVDDVEIIQIVVDQDEGGVQSAANEDDAPFSVDLLNFIEGGTVSNVQGLTSAVTLDGTILNVDPSGDEFQSLAEGEVQIISVTYTVTDGAGVSTQQTAVITITGTNDAPVIAAALAAEVTEDGAAVTIDLLEGASDVDAGDVLSIANLEVLPDGVSLEGSVLSVDPSDAAFQALGAGETQTLTIGYDVVDGNGGSVSQMATITVTGTNDVPVIASALTANATEGGNVITIDLLEGASDVDAADVLSIANLDALPSGVSLEGSVLSVDPSDAAFQALAAGEAQTIVIGYDIVDGNGGSVSQTATITVTSSNDAPIVAAALTASATEDDNSLTIDLLEGASDVDAGDVLSIANLGNLPDGVSLAGNVLSVDPSAAAFQALGAGEIQTLSIGYDIVDGNGGSVSQTATITITGANDAPIVTAALTANAMEDGTGLTIDLLEGASDVDSGDVLSIASLSTLPSGVSVVGTMLSVDPSSAAFQALGLDETQTLSVSYDIVDGNGGSVGQTATITVTGTNDVPVVAAALSASAAENGAVVSLNLLAGASDADQGDVLSVVLAGELPAGVTLEGTTLTLDPNSEAFNSLVEGVSLDVVVNYSIVDSAGASVAQTATFNVVGANDAPIVTGDLDVQTVLIGETISFNPTTLFSEVDQGDSLTFAVTGADGAALPAWLSFDALTGEISGTPTSEDTGAQAIEVTATDTFGASTTQTIFVAASGASFGPGRSILIPDNFADNFTETVFDTAEGVDAHTGTFASDTFIVNPDGGTDILNFRFGNELDTVIIRGATLDELEFSIPDAQGFASDVIMTFPDGSSVTLGTFLQSNVNFVFEQDGLILTPEQTRLAVFDSFFTDGDDEIGPISSPDVLEGGLGDDVISGGAASDTYIFNRGDGNDTYEENGDDFGEGGHQDIVEIRGYNLADATFTRATPASSDLVISFDNGDSVRLVGTLDELDFNFFELIRFDDVEITPETIQMTLLDDSFPEFDQILIGDDMANTLEGGAGDDYLSGGFAGDTYIYTGGNDIIEDGSFTSGDRIEIEGFSSTDADITITEDSGSGPVQIRLDFGAGNSLTIFGNRFSGQSNFIEEIFFAGDNVTQSFLQLLPITETPLGTDGDDVIRGNNTDEILEGGLGNDVLAGSGGNDSYIFNRGDGRDIIMDSSGNTDTLTLTGYNIEDAIFTDIGANADLLVTFVDSSDSILIEDGLSAGDGIESFVFDDATLDQNGIQDASIAQQQTEGDDVIRDFSRDDIIDAGAGNDTIVLTGGNNTINGGLGNDTVNDGAGNDIFNGGDGSDRFQGDNFIFGGSNDTLNGGQGFDVLDGGSGDDILTGGLDSDILRGGDDDDTYVFTAGDGNDFIFETGDNDVLDFNGYDFADAIFSRRDGSSDLLIEFANSTDSVVIGLALGSNSDRYVETFMFDDMTVDFEMDILPLIDILIG